jgi:bacterioferritin-associated ferredoxin
MYVCVCKAVTDTQIKSAICAGVSSRRELFKCLGVGGDCGKCHPHVKELLNNHNHNHCCNQSLMENQDNPTILAA